jgi:uncharacterized membrane protein
MTLPEASEPPTEEQTDRRHRRTIANRAFVALRAQHTAEQTLIGTVAERLNDFASSTPYLVAHVVWFGVWIPWNLGWFGLRPFDPFPFGLLTMVVSLEAIFLAVFVLMAQKRDSAIAELREELALQVNLRIEEESTKTLQLVAGLYTRLGHRVAEDPELRAMMQPLDIASIEKTLASQISERKAAETQNMPAHERPTANPDAIPPGEQVLDTGP